MILDYGKNRARELIRQTSLKLRDLSYEIDETNVDNALSYFERRNDVHYVREKYKSRAAVGIRKTEGESGYETYTKSRIEEMIDQGELEVITIGTGPKVVTERATLFTNKTQSWDYLSGENKERDDETATTIAEQRKAGGFHVHLPNADWIASGIETGPLYVDWVSGHLGYRAFSPNCLHVGFGDAIQENGQERAIDYLSLEDASVVVILLSGSRGDKDSAADLNQYIAYFGRSEKYQYGRRVVFEARSWKDIPEQELATDYRLKSGEIANPLSWMAAKKAKEGVYVPEYPVCLFKGGLTKTSDSIKPLSTSLYESCLEIDIAISKILKASLSSALGKDVLTNELGHEIPRCLEGAILLHKGQTLNIMGQPVANALGAMEITKDSMRAIAEGYGVPGYKVVAMEGGNPESGVALFIRTQPQIEDREQRINVNKQEVERLWNIERYMYEFVTEKPLGNKDTKQVWNPGRYVMPESELDKVTRLTAAMEKGLIDYPRAVRDYLNLPTDRDAMDFIDRMNDPERQAYKAPTATGAQRTGIPLGLGAKLQKPGEPNNNLNATQQGKQFPPKPG